MPERREPGPFMRRIRIRWTATIGFGVFAGVVALGFTLLGERLREALDPKFRR